MKLSFSMLIVAMTLLSSTACSTGKSQPLVLPEVPSFSGDCGKDLNTLIENYVIPIESQR